MQAFVVALGRSLGAKQDGVEVGSVVSLSPHVRRRQPPRGVMNVVPRLRPFQGRLRASTNFCLRGIIPEDRIRLQPGLRSAAMAVQRAGSPAAGIGLDPCPLSHRQPRAWRVLPASHACRRWPATSLAWPSATRRSPCGRCPGAPPSARNAAGWQGFKIMQRAPSGPAMRRPRPRTSSFASDAEQARPMSALPSSAITTPRPAGSCTSSGERGEALIIATPPALACECPKRPWPSSILAPTPAG